MITKLELWALRVLVAICIGITIYIYGQQSRMIMDVEEVNDTLAIIDEDNCKIAKHSENTAEKLAELSKRFNEFMPKR